MTTTGEGETACCYNCVNRLHILITKHSNWKTKSFSFDQVRKLLSRSHGKEAEAWRLLWPSFCQRVSSAGPAIAAWNELHFTDDGSTRVSLTQVLTTWWSPDKLSVGTSTWSEGDCVRGANTVISDVMSMSIYIPVRKCHFRMWQYDWWLLAAATTHMGLLWIHRDLCTRF